MWRRGGGTAINVWDELQNYSGARKSQLVESARPFYFFDRFSNKVEKVRVYYARAKDRGR